MTISDAILYRLRQDSGDIAATPDLSTEEIDEIYAAATDYEAAVLEIVEKRWTRAIARGDEKRADQLEIVVKYWRTRQPMRVFGLSLGLDSTEDNL